MVKHIYSLKHPHKKIEHYDVVILGGGPAGLTSSLYASRYGLKIALIAKALGGSACLARKIENWPGFIGSGKVLMKRFREQAEKFGARFLEAEVDEVRQDSNGFVLYIEGKVIHGRSLILALGREKRKLDIQGEDKFLGKGVSHCTSCDANFFKEKVVSVIGGGDGAAKSSLHLAEVAKKVYLIYRKKELRCEPRYLEKIKSNKKIAIYYNSIVSEILGNEKVEEIKIEQTKKNKIKKFKLKVDGVFIEVGATPVYEILKNLDIKTENDYIIIDKLGKTSMRGVFAAGDNTNNPFKQVVTAAGEGAVAAKSAYDYLRFEYGKKL